MATSTIKTRHREGFSLLEIILAVGLFSLMSVYLLQVYVTAHRLNQQAADMDQSIQLANNILTLVDMNVTGEAVLDHPDFDRANWNKETDIFWIQQWYDDGWNPIGPPGHSGGREAVYETRVAIHPLAKDYLAQVDISIDRIRPYVLWQEEDIQLYRLSVMKYLPLVEVNSQ